MIRGQNAAQTTERPSSLFRGLDKPQAVGCAPGAPLREAREREPRHVPDRSLLRVFRDDRPLALATLVMALVSLAPLTASSVLPFVDLPHHAALSRLLWDVAFQDGSAAAHYAIDPSPMPYWTLYLVLAPLIRLFGVIWGTKVAVALCALSVPLGLMRLLGALGRSAWAGLPAFVLLWDYSLCFGWLNHVLGVGLAFFALAELWSAESPRAALRVWPWGAFLALTHVLPFGFFGLAAVISCLVLPGTRKRIAQITGCALSVPSLTLLPWLARSISTPAAHTQAATRGPNLLWDSIATKVSSLLAFTTFGAHVSHEALVAAAVAFLLLIGGPLCLLLLAKEPRSKPASLAAVPAFTALLLYLALPLSVMRPVEHWGTYPRFASILLLSLWLIPAPRLRGARALGVFATALTAAGWVSMETRRELLALDLEVAPFWEVLRHVPSGARLLPLCYDNTYSYSRRPLGESLHAYITASTGGYNPYLFGQPTNPVHYIAARRLPAPPSWGRRPELFSMRRHGRFYDYILVLGTEDDPVPEDGVALVVALERYKLYRVLPP